MNDDDFSLDELRGHEMDAREEEREIKRRRLNRRKESDNPFYIEEESNDD